MAPAAKQFLSKIRDGQQQGKAWIDAFLVYRDDFEFAPAAREVIQAFDALRAEHNGPAQKALNAAHAAFQQGKRDEGYAKYQEIVDKYAAAALYRNGQTMAFGTPLRLNLLFPMALFSWLAWYAFPYLGELP